MIGARAPPISAWGPCLARHPICPSGFFWLFWYNFRRGWTCSELVDSLVGGGSPPLDDIGGLTEAPGELRCLDKKFC